MKINLDEIAMDNVSGLADRPNNFTSFLTVARKFRYNFVYMFPIMNPEKSTDPETASHVPRNLLWIKNFLTILTKKNDNAYLTVDCRGINPNVLRKFRTKADDA